MRSSPVSRCRMHYYFETRSPMCGGGTRTVFSKRRAGSGVLSPVREGSTLTHGAQKGNISNYEVYLGALVGTLLGAAPAVLADNPIIQTLYSTDPAPYVWNDTVWLFTGHDEPNSDWFTMKDWRLFSSTDMVNWRDWGKMMSVETFSWASADAWAGQVIERNGKFYYYVPVTRRGSSMGIGVGVSDSITGPYKDAIGAPLVANSAIDPTVWIDDDGQAYLYWGNPNLYYIKLNEDMISYSGGINTVDLSSFQGHFEEAPWLYKRGSTYYLAYAGHCCSEDLRYSTAPGPTGPWTYRGQLMPTQGSSFTNHPGIIDYKDGSYLFYHNGALPGGGGFTRSVAVEKFEYGSDGSIPTMDMTTEGAPQIAPLDPYARVEAETIAFSSGLSTEPSSDGGGIHVTSISNGDYIKVKGVGFGDSGAASVSLRVAAANGGAKVELRLGSRTGAVIASCSVDATGGADVWKTISCPLSGSATGQQDLFFNFVGGGDQNLFKFNWWQFARK
ncbi:glycosyl hydrolase [Chaetomium tenue]|uniref:Glycosyl hydrolase n=1 Tax=Chaetomium tenue TaxID=1854479 RepID=A0ACB7PCT3_9PEZI|nr:glycosyl hydrolase [Chaetomium globosum]